MADDKHTDTDSEHADVPGLLPSDDLDCASETSEEDITLPPPRASSNRKKRTRSKTGKKKRKNRKRKSRKTNKRRKINARNTTYASKQKCVDRDAVKEFLSHGDCGCDMQCVQLLQKLENEGAVDVVMQLRQNRFACKCARTHSIPNYLYALRSFRDCSIVNYSHPGGTSCS